MINISVQSKTKTFGNSFNISSASTGKLILKENVLDLYNVYCSLNNYLRLIVKGAICDTK